MKKNKPLWELKQAAQPDTLELFIYGDVEGDYFDWWTWDIVESETSAEHFRNELAKYPDVKFINLYVNSYGGSVYEGMAIRNQLKRHPAYKTAYVDGFACSVASFILTGCDKVVMYSNTMQMIHNMWNVVAGNAKQLRKAADDLDTIMSGNRKAYLEKSAGKITEEKLIELLDAETWLTAEQCLEYGLADEILGQEADLSGAKQMLQKINQTFEQQLSYNRALAAQLREAFVEPKQQVAPVPPNDPEPQVDPAQVAEPGDETEPPKENKTQKFLAALFR